MTALALIHREDIIAEVAKGRLIKSIGADYGISHAAISQNLANDPQYKAARELGAESRLETQYEALEAAQDVLTLARAREGFRAAAWFAEREFPHRWGQHTQVTVSTGDLGERIRRARERVIELEPASVPALGVDFGVDKDSTDKDSK